MKRVIRFNDSLNNFFNAEYAIVCNSSIEEKRYCECYDHAGNEIGCYDAACFSPENSESGYKEGAPVHTQVTALEYHDGHNWRSIVLEHEHLDVNSCDAELLDEDDPLAEEILKQFQAADNPDYKQGHREFETENFEFTQSQFTCDFSIAMLSVSNPAGIIEIM